MSLFDSASLVVTPNGYKEDKLYSIIPTDGSGDLTVTRATTATRVNSDGLIEQVPYNLFTYSEQFDNISWSKINSSITANSAISPDGSMNADKIVENNINAAHFVLKSSTYTGTNTLSVFLKKSERDKVIIQLATSSLVYYAKLVDLTNGTLSSPPSPFTNIATSSIKNFGNGWFRIDMTLTDTIIETAFFLYNGSSYSYTGDGTSGCFIYGAQLEAGTLAKEYFPTTDRLNVPRLDYLNSSCPSILVEPQRTNLLTYSDQINNAAWTNVRGVVTPNTTISPDGTQNADTFVSAAGQSFFPALTRTPSFVGNTNYSLSIFAKVLGNTNVFRMSYVDNVTGFTGGSAFFNLSTQAITIVQSPNSSVTATMQSVGNGWYRLVLNFLTIATPTFNYSSFDITTNDVGNAFALYGGQLEVGTYPTSYIPTVASAVTRNADVISKTGISSLIGQTEGTIFTEFNFTNVGTEKYILNLKDAASSNVISFRRLTSGEIRFVLTATTSSGTTNQSTAVLPNGNYKIAYKYISGSIKIFINGSLSFTLNPTFTFGTPISIIELGNQNGTSQINDSIKQLQLYKTALTDAECIALTTI